MRIFYIKMRIFYLKKKILMPSLPCLNKDMFWGCRSFYYWLFFSLWFFFFFLYFLFLCCCGVFLFVGFWFLVFWVFLRFHLKSLILFLRTKLNPAKYMKFLSSWIADYMTTNICPIFLFLTDAGSTEMEEGSCI